MSDEIGGDDVHKQIWKLIRSHKHARHWTPDAVDDAAMEVEACLAEHEHGEDRPYFDRRFFDTAEYDRIRAAIFAAINLIIDRARKRHKIEVKPGSIDYDEGKARENPKARQRRELPKDEPIGDFDVSDENDGGDLRDFTIDLEIALAKLAPRDRELIDLRIREERSWASIGQAMGMSARAAKFAFARAAGLLNANLDIYTRYNND